MVLCLLSFMQWFSHFCDSVFINLFQTCLLLFLSCFGVVVLCLSSFHVRTSCSLIREWLSWKSIYFGYCVRRPQKLFEPSVLAGFFWHSSVRRGETRACYCQAGAEIQCFIWPPLTSERACWGLLTTAGRVWDFQLPPSSSLIPLWFPWHHRGTGWPHSRCAVVKVLTFY